MLCVCEGNLCRSPAAELLLADALGPDVEVASAGTRAVVGAPIAAQMRALLLGRSIDSNAFRARRLQPAHLLAADLVLTMTVPQRGRAVELAPPVVWRTFTLRELARLLAEVDPTLLSGEAVPERFRQALRAAAARRRYRPDPREDDIADPYGREDAAYRRAFDQVAHAVEVIRAAVVPSG